MTELNKEIEEAFAESGVHEKLYCWFNKYRKQIFAFCAAFFIILGAFTVGIIAKNVKIKNMQQNYLSLDTKDSKLAFVKKYRAQPLCGLVLLNLGDDTEKDGDLRSALGYYELAKKALNNHDIGLRASIACAVTKLRMGDKKFFEQALSDILYNEKIDINFRADALFKLADYFRADEIKIAELMHYATGLAISENWRNYIESSLK